MLELALDLRLGFVALPVATAASWALYNIIYALRNNFPKANR